MKSWCLALITFLIASAVSAHVNDRGMDYRQYKDRYGQSCCGERDCTPAADFVETVVNSQSVVQLLINGIWITVPRSYVVAGLAHDGRAHFCGRLHMAGNHAVDVRPEPVCIILPPRNT